MLRSNEIVLRTGVMIIMRVYGNPLTRDRDHVMKFQVLMLNANVGGSGTRNEVSSEEEMKRLQKE